MRSLLYVLLAYVVMLLWRDMMKDEVRWLSW
jgi:hypothetical protein